ncbi:ATP-binding protein, partial [Mycobacterium tuberculosis]|uniref:ATP-binding protein n=1 Tax=Mycobacterium tuberculosis TaxID=1773 RepID=UPI001BDE62E1
MLRRLDIAALRQDSATGRDELCQVLTGLGFPALIRSGYRPGGVIARVVYGGSELNPVLEMLDREGAWPATVTELVDDAVAVMVDGIGDGKRFVTVGIAEQIESADIHPGDSAFSIPPYSLDEELLARVRELSGKLFKTLALKGVLSLRWAVKHDRLYLLEARPWAGESLAVLAKTGDTDWVALAARAALGEALPDLPVGGDERRP